MAFLKNKTKTLLSIGGLKLLPGTDAVYVEVDDSWLENPVIKKKIEKEELVVLSKKDTVEDNEEQKEEKQEAKTTSKSKK